jgi:NADPH:quinone reductase-like Zn-dependent oxidoreductase
MKAVLWTKYGSPDVLQLREVEKPTPKDNEVLVKIHAATVTAGDCEMRRLKFPFFLSFPMRIYIGFRKPTKITVLGMELAGEVESVGKEVKRFKVGDRVFGTPGFNMGANAEYICLPERPEEMKGVLVKMSEEISYEEAAAVSIGGLEALHFLRQANIQRGQKILINGAGGSIGTCAVQLAKHYGAEVTAVDSTEKLDMLRSIGADHVVDYTQKDFTKSDNIYDVIFDVVGRSPFSRSVRMIKQGGYYLIGNPRLMHMLRGSWTSNTTSRKVIFGTSNHNIEDLTFLANLIEAGKIKTVIDRRYPLEQIVEAHRYVEAGQKRGNVVVTIGHNN